MRNYINLDVSENSFGFSELTRKIITEYIGIMYEDAAEFSDESLRREYYYLMDSGNLHELFEGYGTDVLSRTLIKNYLGNMYEDAADFSDESVDREYQDLRDKHNLHDFFLCDWVFSEEIFSPTWRN